MQTRIKNITPDSTPLSRLPLVIGYFGSVHVMHAELFSKYHHYNVLTFNDFPNKSQSQIYPFKERINNIAKFKPDNIFIYDLNKYNMTADQFIKKVLLKINPSEILVGNDFKFGSDGKRHTVLLGHFKVNTINYNPVISTTKILKLLSEGKVDQANNLLFFPYYYVSKWIAGTQQGRNIGTRTINLLIDHKVAVCPGSYVSRLTIGSHVYRAVTFYGKSLVFNSSNETLETHAIDKNLPPRVLVPGMVKESVKVEFLHFIRPPQNFQSKEQLANTIKNDIQVAKQYFEHNK